MRKSASHISISFCFYCLFPLMGESKAYAHHCRIQTPDVKFGKVDPLQIEGTTAPAAIKLNCWPVTSPTHYCVTVKDNVSERFLKYGIYEIPFNFYYNNIIFGNGGFGKPIIGTIEPIKGQPSQYPEILFSAKLGRPGGLNLKTGTYTGQFQTIVYGAYGRNSLSDAEKEAMCRGQRPAGTSFFTESSQNFTVSARIEKSCSITVTNINFGKITDLDKAQDQPGTVKIRCFSPTKYEIGASSGNNPWGGSNRAMMCNTTALCGHNSVKYDLFHKENSGEIAWNTHWGGIGPIAGFSNNTTEAEKFYARIRPGQKTPPTGTYTDTVIVEIRYR